MLLQQQINEILVRQRDTILNKNEGVERTILDGIKNKIRLPHVIILTGLRRSGKSTLLRQIIKKYYKDEDFYYINFEDERLINFPADRFNELYESLVSLFGNKKTFFLDEIQNVRNFETFIRRFYDEGFKFFITGSSASLLSKEIGTKLTGRHIDIIVKPFSFKEFLAFNKLNIDKTSFYKTETKLLIKKYFDNYLINGGMPEYLTYNDQDTLTNTYDDTIIKDIAVRHNIKNVAVLRQLYQQIITNFANKFSFTKLKKLINVGSVNTIKKYILYLEDTYLVKTINKFDYSFKKQIINDKKLYVLDNGFIRVVSQKFTKDNGWLLENLVFNSLNHNCNIYYYSSESVECDFITYSQGRVLNAIQVCYDFNEDNREREINGIKEAMIKLKLKEGLILTYNNEEDLKVKGKKIKIRPLWKWLLEENTQKSKNLQKK